MTQDLLPPSSDIVFKMLFGDARSSDILLAFLRAARPLPEDDYDTLTLLNPFSVNDYPDDKVGILDVKVKTARGRLIDIEIQVRDHESMRQRIVYYLAKLVTEQAGKGMHYSNLQQSISLFIAKFPLITENNAYHNCYRLYDVDTGSELTDLLEVNTFELSKLPKEAEGSKLITWLKFLNAESREEMEKLGRQNPDVCKAVVKLAELSADEKARMLHEAREKQEMDEQARMMTAVNRGRQEGLQKGRQEGLQEGRQEGLQEGLQKGQREALLNVARSLLKLGRPIEEIEQATGLSGKEIRVLLH